ncbi:coiled-coil domain-containing protein 86 [Polymixia lowei]
MSSREEVSPTDKSVPEVAPEVEEMIPDPASPPSVVTRTRSGRRVRPPAALLDSQVPSPAKAPARRTRKSVLRELPGENTEAESNPVSAMECLSASAGPASVTLPCVDSKQTEPCPQPADVDKRNGSRESCPCSPAPIETAPARPDKAAQKNPHSVSSGKQTPLIPLGKPKSGRVWKDRNKQRFSALVRDKPLRSSWEKKMEAKREKELVKKYSLHLKEEKAKEKEEKRKRREEHLKRRAENERKAEIVQVIRNTTKIKRMKKKHLRRIEKRDTLALLQKSQPKNPKARGRGSNKGDQ